eukprot:GHVU01068658.1.p1 GENE.GHVU01068658.1~~GHVU01068658.1.p1  ORF type:complete len:109 (+),score=3.57 GHVU01068658.1:511-837(+)
MAGATGTTSVIPRGVDTFGEPILFGSKNFPSMQRSLQMNRLRRGSLEPSFVKRKSFLGFDAQSKAGKHPNLFVLHVAVVAKTISYAATKVPMVRRRISLRSLAADLAS